MPISTPKNSRGTLAAPWAIDDALSFFRANVGTILVASVLILIPCFWHRHIEAGDLPSHTYNAWLAQLAGKGEAPGVYLAPQWNNVLFDVCVLRLGNLFGGNLVGLLAAERIVVSSAVLVFFWGVFSFLAAVTSKPPWLFTPCIAMLAYGYAFSMGFINYYFSIGLACFALSLLWRGGAGNWICAAPVAALTLVAHPVGFLWLVSTVAYVLLWRRVAGDWRWVLPALALVVLLGLHFYIARRADFRASWRQDSFYMRNGADQLFFYGHRYGTLSYVALTWGVLCFVVAMVFRRDEGATDQRPLHLALELYAVAFCATALMPENLHIDFYASWIGLLVSRLTLISAILGLAVLNSGTGRRWFFVGFAACAAVFFSFLFQDTRMLNRLEDNADRVVAALPAGTRIVPVVNAPGDWRASFVFHEVERACIGRCFSYFNYEPASLEFRVRVEPGSSVVTSSADDAEAVASGDYVVQDSDPPLTAIYQCDDSDFTKLCAAPLHPGETVETPILENGNQ
jgi:hypothetical protein